MIPDDDMNGVQEVGTKATSKDVLREYRIETFEEMGFNYGQACLLAETPGTFTRLVDTHLVRRVMKGIQAKGATVEDAAVLALRIFL